jgi:hypothetical protein
MGASEWTDPLVTQDPRAVRMPALDDLPPLMWRAMPIFLIGDDETFGREGCANSVSCGEVVFVDEAAEPVAPFEGGR